MDSAPKISIIVPVYNSEKYLEQCLNSVLKQSYSNYEVIMIDDGSTDSSRMIYEKFVHTDKRFVSYHQKITEYPAPEIRAWMLQREILLFS